nr:hypothetical protein [Tanacetum cinerariifolium]
MQMVGGNGGNQFRQYEGQNAGNPTRYNDVIRNQVIQNVVQNPMVQNVGNPNGLIGVQRNGNQNQIGNGNLVAVHDEGNAAGQNGNHISVEQGGETVEQHPVNFEETRALYESLYHNLVIKVEKVNSVNRKLKETNADLTTEL